MIHDSMIRLQGGNYTNEGLVEIYCNGQWRTLCDDGFNGTDATIICKQLGYTGYANYSSLYKLVYCKFNFSSLYLL